MSFKSGLSRFDRMSRLAWTFLVLSLVLISLATQLGSRGSLAAVPSVVTDQPETLLPSVSYGAGLWSLESSRLSPVSATGVTTIIVETQVRNRLSYIDAVTHRDSIYLIADWGETIPLQRFANNDSEKYLHLNPLQTKSVTLVFKRNAASVDLADWQVVIQESKFHLPAHLPLDGDVASSVKELDFDSLERNRFSPVRVAAFPNHGSQRALNGRTFVHLEIDYSGTDIPTGLSESHNWLLSTDNDSTLASRVVEIEGDGMATYQVVFEVESAATWAEVKLTPTDRPSTEFEIVAKNLG